MNRLILLWILFYTSKLHAQNQLTGQVVDESNQVYQHIKLRIEQTGHECWTDRKGVYIFENLPKGTYALSVDYRYDKQYFTVPITASDSVFNIVLTRRIEFDEILIKTYQLDVAEYSNASTLTEEKIKSQNFDKDLPYLLKRVSGVMVQSDAGNGVGYTGLRLRGMDPAHVQVNLNGVPFNDCESSLSYFVDIPDILSQTEVLTVLKGNVPNRAGTPSFGAALDLNTNKIQFNSGFRISTQFGSFNTWKYSVLANSGLLDNKYSLEFGLSRQKSDGYIDRSASDLKSFRFSAGVFHVNSALRFNYIHGSEHTGQAWFGLPVQFVGIDSLRKFNLAGIEKPATPYENEIDQYKQDHLQLSYQYQLSSKLIWNSILNYTYGRGFYENYKSNQPLDDYSIQRDTIDFADLIRRKWLTNHFVFLHMNMVFDVFKSWTLIPGISYSSYNGDHFGDVSWVDLANYSFKKNKYYENTGIKNEFSFSIKSKHQISSKLNLNFDFQTRFVDYKIHGILDNLKPLEFDNNKILVTPKIYLDYRIHSKIQLFSSVGFMQREPFREDYIVNGDSINPEQLFDIEGGIVIDLAKFRTKINVYTMFYKNQLALSGKLNDVGEALRINLNKSYRLGIEFESEYKIGSRFLVWNVGNLSQNKIPLYDEFIPFYGTSTQELYILKEHKNTDISFSPSVILNTGISYSILNPKLQNIKFDVELSHSFVSKYYLDNSSNPESQLPAYNTVEVCVTFQKKIFNASMIKAWIKFYNLLNENYFSHGWISRFSTDQNINLLDDPYLGKENENTFYYKGLYPQALRHVSLGITLDLN
ncbi:MAG: TonB-dependent receptor [Saprospiraceae bacterium]